MFGVEWISKDGFSSTSTIGDFKYKWNRIQIGRENSQKNSRESELNVLFWKSLSDNFYSQFNFNL